MPEDLSYLLSKPTEEEEQRVREAVEQECIRTLVTYLNEVATAMDTNSIQSIDSADLRAMASELSKRLENGENENG
jgi:hypothetical protein